MREASLIGWLDHHTGWIAFALALATFVPRAIGLASNPVGFFADEASTGYDAYAMLLTGCDQYGEFLPLFARSFGDYNESLYRFLTVPAVAIFGLDVFSVRLPAALLGGARSAPGLIRRSRSPQRQRRVRDRSREPTRGGEHTRRRKPGSEADEGSSVRPWWQEPSSIENTRPGVFASLCFGGSPSRTIWAPSSVGPSMPTTPRCAPMRFKATAVSAGWGSIMNGSFRGRTLPDPLKSCRGSTASSATSRSGCAERSTA
jgi:hypothetical protein